MLVPNNSKLVMIGNSITDCDRVRPVGEGLFGELGNGYVNFVNAMIAARAPEKKIRVVNMGIGGNTVRDLDKRWQSDVLDLQPDWLSVKIGINDVWRQFDSPHQPEKGVPIDEYEETLDKLIQKTKPRLKGLILMTPYYIEPNREEPMRAMMDRYGAVVKRLAGKHNTILVDTQAAFDKILEHLPPNTLSGDRVHPNATGHLLIARLFLEAIGFDKT